MLLLSQTLRRICMRTSWRINTVKARKSSSQASLHNWESFIELKSADRIIAMTFGSWEQFQSLSASKGLVIYQQEGHKFEDQEQNCHMHYREASFHDIPKIMRNLGYTLSSCDAVVIDTRTLPSRELTNDSCNLDLRRAFQMSNSDSVSAKEVLSYIDEISLSSLIRKYGSPGLGTRHLLNAIIEARYMFQSFDNVKSLRDIAKSVAKTTYSYSWAQQPTSSKLPLAEFEASIFNRLVYVLRACVNDEINQLHFAIDVVAKEFLRCQGKVCVLTSSRAEQRVARFLLNEINLETTQNPFSDDRISLVRTTPKEKQHWKSSKSESFNSDIMFVAHKI